MDETQNKVQAGCAVALSFAAAKLNESLNQSAKVNKVVAELGFDPQKVQNLPQSLAGYGIGEIILRSVAIEIGFKALIQHSGTNPAHTHNLNSLYQALPTASRDRITAAYDAANDSTLGDLLTNHQSPFVDWRYLYEGNQMLNYDFKGFQSLTEILLAELQSCIGGTETEGSA